MIPELFDMFAWLVKVYRSIVIEFQLHPGGSCQPTVILISWGQVSDAWIELFQSCGEQTVAL